LRGWIARLFLSNAGWSGLDQCTMASFLIAAEAAHAWGDDPPVPLVNAKIIHRLAPHSKLYIFHGGHLGLGTSAQ
jgi:hypothetical protein